MRLEYEIGARGTDEQTKEFVRTIKDEFNGYYTGRYMEETVKSVSGRAWDDLEVLQPRLMGWCVGWSRRFPELEVFYLLKSAYDTAEGTGIRYAEFENGEFKSGTTLVQHDRFVEELGDCDCTVRVGYFEKYPMETPFADCPIRLNPPSAWAVESIMYAHERIGMR